MTQADFAYAPASDVGGPQLTLSIFAESAETRAELLQDAELAGFRPGLCGRLSEVGDLTPDRVGDCAILHCMEITPDDCVFLVQLDELVSLRKCEVIVSVEAAGLEEVFACIKKSHPQILVAPSRAERLIALGRLMALRSSDRLRELDPEDRTTLMKLTEQVGRIAERLERLSAQSDAGESAFRFKSPAPGYHGEGDDGEAGGAQSRRQRPSLPDPRLVRQIVQQRQLRARYFGEELFADPAWDMLLDLTAARAEHKRVSVTSLCIASGVPPTTALRWITLMTDSGLLERVEDEMDRRRAFIALSDKAADAMARYFAELGKDAATLT